jgi:mRNA interferase RelE/StbE
MRYEIILAPQAVEDLHTLSAADRKTVRESLETHLRHQPTQVSRSRIKRLRGLRRPQYRLRVRDDLRVFYDVREMVVEVLAIVSKANADDWLKTFGERDEEGGSV